MSTTFTLLRSSNDHLGMKAKTSSTSPPSQLSYRKRKYERKSSSKNNSANDLTVNDCGAGAENFLFNGISNVSTVIASNSDNDYSDDDDGRISVISGDGICESKSLSNSPLTDELRRNRAHHNELERRRRDHIKVHFNILKNSIPLLDGEKSSRALILKRAVDYIRLLQSQVKEAKLEIDKMKNHNDVLSRATSLLSNSQQSNSTFIHNQNRAPLMVREADVSDEFQTNNEILSQSKTREFNIPLNNNSRTNANAANISFNDLNAQLSFLTQNQQNAATTNIYPLNNNNNNNKQQLFEGATGGHSILPSTSIPAIPTTLSNSLTYFQSMSLKVEPSTSLPKLIDSNVHNNIETCKKNFSPQTTLPSAPLLSVNDWSKLTSGPNIFATNNIVTPTTQVNQQAPTTNTTTTNLNDFLSLLLIKNPLLSSQLENQIKQQQQNVIPVESFQLPPSTHNNNNYVLPNYSNSVQQIAPVNIAGDHRPTNDTVVSDNFAYDSRLSLAIREQQIAAATAAAAEFAVKVSPITSPISKLTLG